MLTKKQHELLMFIHERIRETGVSPSFDEMKEALDLASKSGIHRLITALEERGFIRRLAHRARAIEVVKLPDNMDPPRKGCDDATLQAVLQMAPPRIVMVSCNAATAARDAKILAASGYELQRLQPVDMFPRTKLVECCCLLERASNP